MVYPDLQNLLLTLGRDEILKVEKVVIKAERQLWYIDDLNYG